MALQFEKSEQADGAGELREKIDVAISSRLALRC
jgi:hypothetical protein